MWYLCILTRSSFVLLYFLLKREIHDYYFLSRSIVLGANIDILHFYLFYELSKL